MGAADGTVRLYAVSDLTDAPPPLVRTCVLRGEAITALSLMLDPNSREAATLDPTRQGPLPGLALLTCDGAGPPLLIEVLSGLGLIPDSAPTPLQAGSRASLGQWLFDGEKPILALKVHIDAGTQLVSLTKDASSGTQFEDQTTILPDAQEVTELVRGDGTEPILVALLGGGGWKLYVRDGNQFKAQADDGRAVRCASITTLGQPFKRHYMITPRPNGAVRTWVQGAEVDLTKWDAVTLKDDPQPADDVPRSDHPARVSAAALGRVVVPLVASRGEPDRLGRTWAADLGAAVSTWPEALGPIEDDAPVALAGLGGSPHLAVGRSSDLTVWNLDTGRLVARIGLDEKPASLDAASDLDQLWLLVALPATEGPRSWFLVRATDASLRPSRS